MTLVVRLAVRQVHQASRRVLAVRQVHQVRPASLLVRVNPHPPHPANRLAVQAALAALRQVSLHAKEFHVLELGVMKAGYWKFVSS